MTDLYSDNGYFESEVKKFEVMPKGEYTVLVSKIDNRLTKSNQEYLNIELQVVEGKFSSRKIWTSIFPNSTSEKAMISLQIAFKTIQALGMACIAKNKGDEYFKNKHDDLLKRFVDVYNADKNASSEATQTALKTAMLDYIYGVKEMLVDKIFNVEIGTTMNGDELANCLQTQKTYKNAIDTIKGVKKDVDMAEVLNDNCPF